MWLPHILHTNFPIQTMTVYMRTEEGQLAAYSADSVLPRKLRSLLKVIDGKTSLEVYSHTLHAFGDVKGVLRSLDLAGLIRPMSQLPAGAPRAAEASGSNSGNSGNSGGHSKSWANSQQQNTLQISRTSANSQFRPSQTTHGPNTTASFMNTRSAHDSQMAYGDPAASFARSQALARAIDSMSNFVLTNAPEHSFLILKELEQITQLEQLAVTLGGYEQLISHLGAPAQEHLGLIKGLLRDYM
jgi:hypothetical protein